VVRDGRATIRRRGPGTERRGGMANARRGAAGGQSAGDEPPHRGQRRPRRARNGRSPRSRQVASRRTPVDTHTRGAVARRAALDARPREPDRRPNGRNRRRSLFGAPKNATRASARPRGRWRGGATRRARPNSVASSRAVAKSPGGWPSARHGEERGGRSRPVEAGRGGPVARSPDGGSVERIAVWRSAVGPSARMPRACARRGTRRGVCWNHRDRCRNRDWKPSATLKRARAPDTRISRARSLGATNRVSTAGCASGVSLLRPGAASALPRARSTATSVGPSRPIERAGESSLRAGDRSHGRRSGLGMDLATKRTRIRHAGRRPAARASAAGHVHGDRRRKAPSPAPGCCAAFVASRADRRNLWRNGAGRGKSTTSVVVPHPARSAYEARRGAPKCVAFGLAGVSHVERRQNCPFDKLRRGPWGARLQVGDGDRSGARRTWGRRGSAAVARLRRPAWRYPGSCTSGGERPARLFLHRARGCRSRSSRARPAERAVRREASWPCQARPCTGDRKLGALAMSRTTARR
jgi:hypothetical protein